MLELVPLGTAIVDLDPPLRVGSGPLGARTVAAINGVRLDGDRLKATLASPAAADWMIQNGAIGAVDVRMTLRTEDDALIHMTYTGRIDTSDREKGVVAWVAPLFETGDERYAWLNAIQAVGKGTISVADGKMRVTYELCELR